ncbi:hypothetical protein TNCV_2767241 [Trichonephila clavipes]|nr:hypothetical protein TNCV_2767241 [Trichonephila clavipes]
MKRKGQNDPEKKTLISKKTEGILCQLDFRTNSSSFLCLCRQDKVGQQKSKNQDTSLLEQEQLIERSTDSMLKCRYKREDLDFWLKIHKEYSQISTKALMPFVATYLTKNPFQHMLEEKQNIGIS